MTETTGPVYEASVYSRTITYRNLKGLENTVDLTFALDPLTLLEVMGNFNPKKSKSANPAKRGQEEFDEGAQIELVRTLCVKSAGVPSQDGEYWMPIEHFEQTIAGKAFLTKLTASDADRKEFAEKVILDPIRAFVGYAKAEADNTPADIQLFESTLTRLENIFSAETAPNETPEQRRARLQAELDAIQGDGQTGE